MQVVVAVFRGSPEPHGRENQGGKKCLEFFLNPSTNFFFSLTLIFFLY